MFSCSANLFVLVILCPAVLVQSSSVFDEELYESVLDPVLCDEHLTVLSNNTYGLLQFIDASGKLPTGILQGNLNDLGDYHYCLSMDYLIQDQRIQGKYCSISIPLVSGGSEVNGNQGIGQVLGLKTLDDQAEDVMTKYDGMRRSVLTVTEGRTEESSPRAPIAGPGIGITLGVCVPRACTPSQAMTFYLQQLPVPSTNFTFTERFCRLPGDKPFSSGDYVAMALFSLIGSLTLISTSYDLCHVFALKSEPKHISRIWTMFSVYTNTRRFVTVTSIPGALDCIDGVRTISMLWVILGHTFSMTMTISVSNWQYVLEFLQSYRSVWVNAATISVDTFFLLSGILCVYSTIGKINRISFIKGVPLFYLHRLLRMFPLLATMVLLQASLINHLSDGPQWTSVAGAVQACRKNWWAALLHVQNYRSDLSAMCLGQTWYLSVDVQLYMACPLVLVFLFGRRRHAWLALAAALVLALFSSSFYSFYYNFPGVLFQLSRLGEVLLYFKKYYINTLTRAPPFVVGMVVGYLLHLYREKRMRISMYQNCLLWLLSLAIMSLAIFHVPAMAQPGYENQILDNLVNAYVRALWAAALGFVLIACVQGYGGPVNWFLSLRMWKLPARLSYAMYLTHYSLLYVSTGSITQTHRFGVAETVYRFSADLVWTVIAAFILSIFIDAPCSTLQKILLGGASKPKKNESLESVTVAVESLPSKSAP